MTQKTWPYDQTGIIIFSAGRCSGTKVSARHIITSGHCCHSGGSGGNWFSNWVWYPGATRRGGGYSEIDVTGHAVYTATSMYGWVNDRNFDYDICWLTLQHPYYGWFGFGYHTGISTSWSFDM